jgi:hypothetical protein
MKLDLEPYTYAGGSNKVNRVSNVIRKIRDAHPAEEADRLIFSLAREYLENRIGDLDKKRDYIFDEPTVSTEFIRPLLQALEADGWKFSGGKLIPETPEPAALAPEISRLQHDLQQLGLEIAATHYRHALDNFRERRCEASNGQLRCFLENLYIELCTRQTGRPFTDPGSAIQHLRQTGHIGSGEYNLARGLLEVSNERGAHHGVSDEEEALFKFHFSTALGRYLISRIIGR